MVRRATPEDVHAIPDEVRKVWYKPLPHNKNLRDYDALFMRYAVTEGLEAPEDEDEFGEGDDHLITKIYGLWDEESYVEVLVANSGKKYYRITTSSRPRYGERRYSTTKIYDANNGNYVNKDDLEFIDGIVEEEAPASEFSELSWLPEAMKDRLGIGEREDEFGRRHW